MERLNQMTKTDFAELKEKLTKLDDVAANEYLTRYMEGFYDEPTYKEYGEYVHTKSAAIISELIEIIQSQSECMNGYSHDYITLKMNACIAETTTRLQKLRDGNSNEIYPMSTL